MNVMVTVDQRFQSLPDGTVWTPAQFRYGFFTRYLEVFDHVCVAGRVKEGEGIPDGWERVDGPGVSVMPVPFYLGPLGYVRRAHQVRQAASRAVQAADAVILRVPSIIAATAERALRRNQRPYGLEIIGDPYDWFAPGAVEHPLRPLFRMYFYLQLRRQCRDACATAYVTKEALQKRYRAPGVFHASYSDVELGSDAFAPTPLNRESTHKAILISVGSFDQLYKGHDVLLKALSRCVQTGLSLTLVLVGDGRYRAKLEALAADLHLSEQVLFLGQLPPGRPIREQLDLAHLFVLPSRTEGLPRALIEAMARGLPCVGSTVGGIPELLEPEDLVPPGDATALAAKIREVVMDTHRMARMSARNLAKARQYREDEVCKPRTAFYRYVRERTETWRRTRM
jgi:glycosyltransferase involved in cell wall biosynthesis